MELSRDPIGIADIIAGADFHTDNQKLYKFPGGKEGRDLAKTFIFRAIYKGPAYAYANDPRFKCVSTSEKFWQRVIDATYEKYAGLASWHGKIIREVNATGRLTAITGRVYEFKRGAKGGYPEREIVNHPVQGLGAEIMAVCRVSAYNRYQKFYLKDRMKFVNTVHDSIVVDANVAEGSKELSDICVFLSDIFNDCGGNFERLFKVKLAVPFTGETKHGMNWASLTKFKG